MVQRVATVAFEGIEARAVDVQVQVAAGLPAFIVVGLPDKSVTEARQRVRSALIASGLALPARRITVNLAPADLPKEGTMISRSRSDSWQPSAPFRLTHCQGSRFWASLRLTDRLRPSLGYCPPPLAPTPAGKG
jgi:predicted ATPase with chaperone activity